MAPFDHWWLVNRRQTDKQTGHKKSCCQFANRQAVSQSINPHEDVVIIIGSLRARALSIQREQRVVLPRSSWSCDVACPSSRSVGPRASVTHRFPLCRAKRRRVFCPTLRVARCVYFSDSIGFNSSLCSMSTVDRPGLPLDMYVHDYVDSSRYLWYA